MNWRTVLLLVNANRKSYRAIRGAKLRRYQENKLFTYFWYILACVVGVLAGYLIGGFYSASNQTLKNAILDGAAYFLVSIPTIVLLYGVFFTQINQAQRIGAKVSVQPIYWFPISWQEHTLASIISSLLGAPLAITILISSAVLTVSVFLGLIPLAVLTVLALLASLLLASITTEILKTLQVRLSGAVTKAAGKSAIWLRLAISVGSMLVFYLVYFSIYNQISPAFLFESVTGAQRALWFIPYVWPGMALSAFAGSLWMETLLFSLATLAFTAAVFFAATYANTRFGLYELPAIRLSSGVYTPKPSMFAKLGFSPTETALMKKDFKTITRRHELSFIFIFPISMLAMLFITTLRSSQASGFLPVNGFYVLFALTALIPGVWIAFFLGSMLTGLEGSSIWYVFSSPVSAKSIARSKFFFVALFSLCITIVCSIIGGVVFRPSPLVLAVTLLEAVFLICVLSAISVAIGIKAADFRGDFPYSRVIKPKWNLLNFLLCAAVGLAVVAPIIPYALTIFPVPFFPAMPLIPEYYVYAGLLVSGIIATGVTCVFRGVAVSHAEQVLAEAESI
jgi:hypothetical protein